MLKECNERELMAIEGGITPVGGFCTFYGYVYAAYGIATDNKTCAQFGLALSTIGYFI